MKTPAIAAILAGAAVALAPVSRADMPLGNYELVIPGRYDFHTWVWNMSPCSGGCIHVSAIARPVAKAFAYQGDARFADGKYVLTVDVPDGLRCDDVYYGPVIATHDTYTWDARTRAGALTSSFATGCDGAGGASNTYAFTLTQM